MAIPSVSEKEPSKKLSYEKINDTKILPKLKVCANFNENLNRNRSRAPDPSLGILRLDYDYPPNIGHIDCPESFNYKVYYRIIPGLTFKICQSGIFTEKIKTNLEEAVRWLTEEKKVNAITGDCGFMMYLQPLVRSLTNLPVFMSSICLLPSILCAFSSNEEIIILTANGEALEKMSDLISRECGIDTYEQRYHIIGMEGVKGFEAVEKGSKVINELVEPGVVNRAKEALYRFPNSRAFLLECTELPTYSNAIKNATRLPVYDSFSVCNFFMESLQCNKKFGKQDWQKSWNGKQEAYEFGKELSENEKADLVCKQHPINRLKKATTYLNMKKTSRESEIL